MVQYQAPGVRDHTLQSILLELSTEIILNQRHPRFPRSSEPSVYGKHRPHLYWGTSRFVEVVRNSANVMPKMHILYSSLQSIPRDHSQDPPWPAPWTAQHLPVFLCANEHCVLLHIQRELGFSFHLISLVRQNDIFLRGVTGPKNTRNMRYLDLEVLGGAREHPLSISSNSSRYVANQSFFFRFDFEQGFEAIC